MSVPPQYRERRDVRAKVGKKPRRARVVRLVVPASEAAWWRAVAAKLNADELAFMQRAIAKMGPERRRELVRLPVDDAVAHLRIELGNATAPITTREP